MSNLPEQNTDEWKEWRRQKIGASDIPIIIGVSPYCTPLLLWKRKLGFEPEQQMHAGMRFGHENESHVRELMQQRLGYRLDDKTMQHKEHDWAIASLDGYNEEHDVLIEIKCCNKDDHAEAKEGRLPEKYYPQVQWQMFVSGCREAYYCSWNSDDLCVVEVPYDEDFIEKTFQEALQFRNCLLEYDPPAPSNRDHIEIDDPDFGENALAWQQAKETLEHAKQQEKFYRDKLIEFTDDGNCQGYGIRLTRVSQKGTIDWDKVCEKYNIDKKDLDEFRREQIGFWKITAMKEQ